MFFDSSISTKPNHSTSTISFTILSLLGLNLPTIFGALQRLMWLGSTIDVLDEVHDFNYTRSFREIELKPLAGQGFPRKVLHVILSLYPKSTM